MKSKRSAPGRKPAQKDKKPYSLNKGTKKTKASNQQLTELIDSHPIQLLSLAGDEPTKTPAQGKTREQKIQVPKPHNCPNFARNARSRPPKGPMTTRCIRRRSRRRLPFSRASLDSTDLQAIG